MIRQVLKAVMGECRD